MRRVAILPAAGNASRLGSLADIMPKCLLPGFVKPLLFEWIDRCLEAGYEEIYVNIFRHAEIVESALREEGYLCNIRLVYESELSGTGGFFRTVISDFFERFGAFPDTIFFAHVDVVANIDATDLAALESVMSGTDSLGCLVTYETQETLGKGMVVAEHAKFIEEFVEKPSEWKRYPRANAGFCVINGRNDAFKLMLTKKDRDFFGDIFPSVATKFLCFHVDIVIIDIGTVTNLDLHLSQNQQASQSPTSVWTSLLYSLLRFYIGEKY